MTDQPEYEIAATADNEAIAGLMKQKLEAEGIPTVLVPGDMAAFAGSSAQYDVTVPAEHAEAAKALLGEGSVE